MKAMSDRKMDMSVGKPKSEGFFPEEAHSKDLKSPREIRGMKYPDTQEEILKDQEQAVMASDRGAQDAGYRH